MFELIGIVVVFGWVLSTMFWLTFYVLITVVYRSKDKNATS